MSDTNSFISITTKDGDQIYLGTDWGDKKKEYKVEWNSKKGITKSIAIHPPKSEADTLTKLFFNIGITLLKTHGSLKKIDEPDLDDISEKGKKNILSLAKVLTKDQK
ncbi:MAG: hypothetical protein C4617_05050 [Candidatus Liberibacter europaeus]|uniref:Uncharacterized protein n=1 Tax=Candidatus Liberibacter europaeus TaxID=744859 RepID=A0A2T4VWI0_9HYPH|nr:hypothetical protein [Candidatus Liberibacter europaeus]PTL86135.1 MAG: hypothetical protein C4617_05050 [Candidatus Liberibacter europaeus]